MKKNRLIALLLTIVLLLTAVTMISCGDDGKGENNTKKTGDTTTEATELYGNVPDDLNFGGQEEVRFLTADTSRGQGAQFSVRSIGIENYVLGTNAVDDEVYKRNNKAEDRLGVVITNTVAAQYAIIKDVTLTDLQSGASEFDILQGYQAHDIALAQKGLLLDMNKLDDDADFLDFKAEYWGTVYTNAISYNKICYWATGDLSLVYIGGTYCTYVNTELYANAVEGKSPEGSAEKYGSIYSVVESGNWTLETLQAMGKMVYDDKGTTEGKVDKEDTLGFVIELIDPLDGLAIGAGVDFSALDPGGNIFIVLGDAESNNKAADFIDAVYNLLNKSGVALNIGANHSANCMGAFANGNVLFVHDKIYHAENYLTNMENYGIIPSPKLNTEQTSYRSGIHDECGLFGIYANTENVSAAAATLETLACLSLQTVTPAYYDTALKYRYTRDENSAAMIDLIRHSVYIDFAFAWGNSLGAIHNFFRSNVNKPSSTSTFKSMSSVWEINLEDLLEELDAAAEALNK